MLTKTGYTSAKSKIIKLLFAFMFGLHYLCRQRDVTMHVSYRQMTELIKQNVHEVDPSAKVLLYGSRARGDARSNSDWDVLVLSTKDKLTFKEEEQFMDHICDVMIQTGQAIQLFAYGTKDWHQNHSITPFYKNVQSEAVLL